ncbi:hypothetical protein MNO14_05800 [Luteimonas sp. S4-F44]|uniref:hypothetical protein n=1 Tax=Luteimonas sp. S4-F44 TaxID=2925842 RepID=UPI001F52F617|nr:hypothetical protein [Luteimonas sp. S4-F44]UNK43583.1 hypothetical protein MNO14_05800 [Luteimonas sp. S4-F44]
MSIKSEARTAVAAEGRVLARVLSREEIAHVSGGAGALAEPTDSWVDNGTCTPKSDPPLVSDPHL